MNKIEIEGIICRKQEAYTQEGKCLTTFGLNFYNGKKDGKSVYEFIDCKMWDKTQLNNHDKVNIVGWLSIESWEKDDKKVKKAVIIVTEMSRK